MLQVPDISEMEWYRSNDENELDIESVINGEEDESTATDNKADVIYIAILPPTAGENITASTVLSSGGTYSGTIWHPRPRLLAFAYSYRRTV